MKKAPIIILIVLGLVVGLLVIGTPWYIVYEGEHALVTRFGELTTVESEAGLKFKMPFVNNITKLPKRILSWDGEARLIPTLENEFIWVDSTARWRIVDVKKFYEAATTLTRAYARLDEVLDPAIRKVISTNPLMEAVRSSDLINTSTTNPLGTDEVEIEGLSNVLTSLRTYDKVRKGRRKLSEEILSDIQKTTLDQFGIEVLDILIRQIQYSDNLRESVYNRMIAERKQIAEGFRSFGQGRKQELLGTLEREKLTLLSEAYRQSEQIKGKADATAADLYANAYRQDSDFYQFWRALDSYKQTLTSMDKTLTTDLDYFRYLYSPAGR